MARWWKQKDRYTDTLRPRWNYYVSVCSFMFHFNSPEEIPKYIEHYQTKILPSRRLPGPIPGRQWGDHEEARRWYERLPLRLRDESKRHQVVKALSEALADFRKQEARGRNR